MGIVLLEYLTLAWHFGTQNANQNYLIKVGVELVVLLIIMKNMGSLEVGEREWIPLFGRKPT